MQFRPEWGWEGGKGWGLFPVGGAGEGLEGSSPAPLDPVTRFVGELTIDRSLNDPLVESIISTRSVTMLQSGQGQSVSQYHPVECCCV